MSSSTTRDLETVVDWIRPLVEAKEWDYCVVWRLTDDPSRFLEFMGCCCGGGYQCAYVKDEEGEEEMPELCRDGFIEHRVKTRACEALALLPSSMPLYSGVHTEVVISDQPRWFSGHANASNSNPSKSNDATGTRILIPVLLSGLIELYSTKNIPENQKMLDSFMNSFNVSLNQEVMNTNGNANVNLKASASQDVLYLNNWFPSSNLPNFSPRPKFLPLLTQSTFCLNRESSSLNPSTVHPPVDIKSTKRVAPHGSLNPSEKSSRKPKCGDSLLKQQAVEKANVKAMRRTGDEHFSSKNLAAERRRRNRIREMELSLRALVPKITKMDKSSIPSDAIDYIHELKKKIKELEDELREMEEEDSGNKEEYDGVSAVDKKKGGNNFSSAAGHKKNSPTPIQKSPTEVLVEVYQLGKRDCLVKFFCEQSRDGFTRLMETMNSLGLDVVDLNVTTFDRSVLNILRVEAQRDIQAKKLRDILIKLTRETNQRV